MLGGIAMRKRNVNQIRPSNALLIDRRQLIAVSWRTEILQNGILRAFKNGQDSKIWQTYIESPWSSSDLNLQFHPDTGCAISHINQRTSVPLINTTQGPIKAPIGCRSPIPLWEKAWATLQKLLDEKTTHTHSF